MVCLERCTLLYPILMSAWAQVNQITETQERLPLVTTVSASVPEMDIRLPPPPTHPQPSLEGVLPASSSHPLQITAIWCKTIQLELRCSQSRASWPIPHLLDHGSSLYAPSRVINASGVTNGRGTHQPALLLVM